MINQTFRTLCYEIAMLSLPRVTFSEVPGIQGVVIRKTVENDMAFVHWGKMDKRVVEIWHEIGELTFIDRGVDNLASELEALN